MRLPWLALLVAPLLLAGCASDATPPEALGAAATLPPEGATGPRTTLVNGTYDALTAPRGTEPCHTGVILGTPVGKAENIGDAIEVSPNATALLVELRWSDPSTDLDLVVNGPDQHGYVVGVNGVQQPGGTRFEACEAAGADALATILVDDPATLAVEGDAGWGWTVLGKGRVAAEPFTVAITIFEDGATPEGYSGLPPTG